ncbi:MAG: hypothetical protein R6U84_09340 [Candidatus Cloacimonadales bacterium]
MNLACGKEFHIYTRANSNLDELFTNREDYQLFLNRYQRYLEPVFHTLAFCLMPNHYHLLVREKEAKKIIDTVNETNKRIVLEAANALPYVRQQISNFHNSYAKAFNKIHQRRGSLFQTKPKSKEIIDLVDLLELFRYIHNNPVNHGLVKDLQDWEFSSYLDYTAQREIGFISKDELIQHFTTIEELKSFLARG